MNSILKKCDFKIFVCYFPFVKKYGSKCTVPIENLKEI